MTWGAHTPHTTRLDMMVARNRSLRARGVRCRRRSSRVIKTQLYTLQQHTQQLFTHIYSMMMGIMAPHDDEERGAQHNRVALNTIKNFTIWFMVEHVVRMYVLYVCVRAFDRHKSNQHCPVGVCVWAKVLHALYVLYLYVLLRYVYPPFVTRMCCVFWRTTAPNSLDKCRSAHKCVSVRVCFPCLGFCNDRVCSLSIG